jgi:Mrp family chromosome partitioning ATPase
MHASDARDALGTPLLGTFKFGSERTSGSSGNLAPSLAAASLDALCKKSGARTVAVMSVEPRTNAVSVAYTLAGGYVANGSNVLVLDLAHPDIGSARPLAADDDSAVGLAQVAQGRLSLDEVTRVISLHDGSTVSVITSGHTDNQAPVRWSEAVEDQLAGASAYDVILVAMPDLHQPNVPIGVLTRMDAAVLAVRRRLPLRPVRELADALAGIHVPLVGYIFVTTRWGRSSRDRTMYVEASGNPLVGAEAG